MASWRIYRNTKEEVNNQPIVDGQMLYTTDQGTKNKIYVDNGTERITIGGNLLYNGIGVLYPTNGISVTFPVSGWSSSSPYTNNVAISSTTLTTSDLLSYAPNYLMNGTKTQDTLLQNYSYLTSFSVTNGVMTATAEATKPTVDLTVLFVTN